MTMSTPALPHSKPDTNINRTDILNMKNRICVDMQTLDYWVDYMSKQGKQRIIHGHTRESRLQSSWRVSPTIMSDVCPAFLSHSSLGVVIVQDSNYIIACL